MKKLIVLFLVCNFVMFQTLPLYAQRSRQEKINQLEKKILKLELDKLSEGL